VPDFPEEGIQFRDMTPLLHDHRLFGEVTDYFRRRYQGEGIDQIAAIESRGFIFGSALAPALGVAMSLVRKPGKLPREVHRAEYELEYGKDTLEIHTDAIDPGERVVVIDDLLATGGTCSATVDLIESCGGEVVECGFLLELGDLDGRERLSGYDVHSIVNYE
jgi:adenine phosphoribosyltransferase